MTRLDPTEDYDPIADALRQLHRAGWSVGDVTAGDGAGGLLWIVCGVNGENLIRAAGPTAVEAWGRATVQARLLGMLGDRP
jgi:hypothetical protein